MGTDISALLYFYELLFARQNSLFMSSPCSQLSTHIALSIVLGSKKPRHPRGSRQSNVVDKIGLNLILPPVSRKLPRAECPIA